jgi:hypothetical protein
MDKEDFIQEKKKERNIYLFVLISSYSNKLSFGEDENIDIIKWCHG